METDRQHQSHGNALKSSSSYPSLSLYAGSIIFNHEKDGLSTRITLKAVTSQKEARESISPGRGIFTDSSGVETSTAP
jgi:hypothetical protein